MNSMFTSPLQQDCTRESIKSRRCFRAHRKKKKIPSMLIVIGCFRTGIHDSFSCYFPLMESNQRSSPDKASPRITKKRIWLLCYISRLKGTQFFVIRPFLPIVLTLVNSRWTGRTHPRCLDGPPRGFDVIIRWL